MSRLKIALLAGTSLTLLLTGLVQASSIHTGGARGAYNGSFCPPLVKELDKARFNYKCRLSLGSNENIKKVTASPKDIGFAQFDVFALTVQKKYPAQPYHVIRNDIARECVFMVTKNKNLESYGDVAARAEDLNFVLPPRGSGSASTFDFLREVDPNGLGRAIDISHAESTDLAIKKALSDENTVTLFVQFPDPNNDRFKAIAKEKGLFVPVIDRNILRQQVDDQKIYFAQETGVSNGKFWKKGAKVTTSCTPMVIFTGNPELMNNADAKLDQKDLISTINDISAESLLPKQGFFKKLWSKTRALSADSVEKMMKASEKAREKAGPMMQSAKEKARELGDKAAPMLDSAKERARELGERAMDKARDLGDAAREKMDR